MKKRPLADEEEEAIRDIISEFGELFDFFGGGELKKSPYLKDRRKKKKQKKRGKNSDEERTKTTKEPD